VLQVIPIIMMLLLLPLHPPKPLRAGLVKKMEDWEFSSFRDYMNIGMELFVINC